jgi:hypothetical protein
MRARASETSTGRGSRGEGEASVLAGPHPDCHSTVALHPGLRGVGGHFPESGLDTFLRAVGRAVRVAVSARRARSGPNGPAGDASVGWRGARLSFDRRSTPGPAGAVPLTSDRGSGQGEARAMPHSQRRAQAAGRGQILHRSARAGACRPGQLRSCVGEAPTKGAACLPAR